MTRGILIAGNESSLFSALGMEALKRVASYAAAPVPAGTELQDRNVPAGASLLEWNPASPISARTLIISGINKLEHIDDAILVCLPPVYRRPVEELFPAEVERIIDANVKSWFFLVKEITSVFRARKRGTLALVLSEAGPGSNEDVPDLVGPAVGAAFRAFAQNTVIVSLNAPYQVMGFSSSEPGEEEAFASFVFKIIDEGKKNSGKWHKHGKFGIFGR
jgi:NAD(P)-dependent dehydrogenase (short-subunit alcohol dehydrogenase family)